MSQRMYITLGEKAFCVYGRIVSILIKFLRYQLLIILEPCVQVQVINHFFVDRFNLIEKFLRFGGGVAETPCTREIVEVTAACFTRENIKDNGLSQPQRIRWVAHRVRYARVAP